MRYRIVSSPGFLILGTAKDDRSQAAPIFASDTPNGLGGALRPSKRVRIGERTTHPPKRSKIASYALLTHMVANECNLIPGEFIWTGGDVHLYLNHQEQARTQLCRTPLKAPTLIIKPAKFFEHTLKDFMLLGYDPYPAIKAEVAV